MLSILEAPVFLVVIIDHISPFLTRARYLTTHSRYMIRVVLPFNNFQISLRSDGRKHQLENKIFFLLKPKENHSDLSMICLATNLLTLLQKKIGIYFNY